MHLAKTLKPWFGVCLGLLMAGLPLTTMAVEFNPPKRSMPGRREGAGTRGPKRACIEESLNLTMLLPRTNVGMTTEEYPRFFWYVPKTRAKTAKFILFQGNEEEPEQEIIYTATMDVSGEAGVLSLQLPKNGDVPPLEVGKDYHWAVTLQCNPDDPISDVYVNGWVHRAKVEPGLADRLKTATPSDRLQLYAQNGLWLDTVSTLADMRCTNPNSSLLAQSWSELMQSVELSKIANQPLATCPKVQATKTK